LAFSTEYNAVRFNSALFQLPRGLQTLRAIGITSALRLTRALAVPLLRRSTQLGRVITSDPFTAIAKSAIAAPGSGRSGMMAQRQ